MAEKKLLTFHVLSLGSLRQDFGALVPEKLVRDVEQSGTNRANELPVRDVTVAMQAVPQRRLE